MIRVLSVANKQNRAVSQILGIDDDFIAFCIDEAATYIYYQLLDGKKTIDDQEQENDGLQLLMKVAEEKK